MSLDRIEHARHLLAEAGELLTADPSQLYWLARQVGPLLDLLDGIGYSREVDNGDPAAVPPPGVLGFGHPRGTQTWTTAPSCLWCGVPGAEFCTEEHRRLHVGSETTWRREFESPLRIGR